MPKTDRPIVISLQELYYIDTGASDRKGQKYAYGKYYTWRDLYHTDLQEIIKDNHYIKANVKGAEITLWGEVSNLYTHHVKIWIRGSSFAEDLWGKPQVVNPMNFLSRLTAHERLMNRRGIPTAPATSQYCEFESSYCDYDNRKNSKINNNNKKKTYKKVD